MTPRRRKSPFKSILNETHSNVTSKNELSSSQSFLLYWKALISTFITHDWLGYAIGLFVTFILDAAIIWYMLNKVKYTNIDWTAYMEQVRIYRAGERNYFRIRGDTGPLVYPAGHLYIYNLLNYLSSDGNNIKFAQYIFTALYILNQILVYSLFFKSKKIGSGVLIFMVCISHRIHSIFILRLFNDPIAMILFFISVNLMVHKRFPLACIFYSLAVTVKMNILLFAPAVFFILLFSVGPTKTVFNLAICAIVQILVGIEFICHDPLAYLGRAFELGRVFQYRWSVNWQFIPEDLFLASNFHLLLLLGHIILLFVFIFSTWFRQHGGVSKLLADLIREKKLVDLDTNDILYALFTANLAGIVFARSIHFQFYTWYYHSLFYLLYSSLSIDLRPPDFKDFIKVLSKWIGMFFVLAAIELVYNIYPPRSWSSFLLFVEHMIIVIWLIYQAHNKKEEYLKVEQ